MELQTKTAALHVALSLSCLVPHSSNNYAGLKHFYKLTEVFRYSIHYLADNRID